METKNIFKGYLFIPLLLLIIIFITGCHSQSDLINKIYSNVQYPFPCVRILTKDGEVGCSSKINGGNSGELYLIDDNDALEDFLGGNNKNLVIVLDTNYFNKTIVQQIQSKCQGIFVLTDTKKSYSYSPDESYPLKKFGLYPNSEKIWNPLGDSFLYGDVPIPIFALDLNTSIAAREAGGLNKKGTKPTWGAQFDSFMHGGFDTETCLRRGFCVPIGGKSIWTSFSPVLNQEKEIILVMVPMDTNAYFHDMAIGADASTFAQVILISMVETFSRMDKTSWNKEVIFATWDTERWGYIGSTKFVDDLLNFKCDSMDNTNPNQCNSPPYPDISFTNINFEKISTIIELNQIGRPEIVDNSTFQLYLHSLQSNSPLTKAFLDKQSIENTTSLIYKASKETELPPSSSMSFLKKNISIPTVIITDHDGAYSNPYFGDHLDDSDNVNPKSVFPTIISLVSIINELASGQPTNVSTIQLNEPFISQIYSCFLYSFSCNYVITLLDSYPYNTYPTFYSNVYGVNPTFTMITLQTQLVYYLLANITATQYSNTTCRDNSGCNYGQSCIAHKCITTNTHIHPAISLAFDYNYKKSAWFIKNDSYPTFVESNWDYTSARFYQMDSHASEAWFLVAGLLILATSILVIFISKRFLSKRYKLL
ncbi:hypothetical protein CYY_003991 [Polysphondylium violaceum]|uniref:Nicastrin n=1 Tax=Polysphondylium violaceum TaxID=133409 RepID=A0A8J4UZP4_9MYCE|nr:hypothetical protein CYY_003991 [Polysphondylium violaceum]